AARSGTLGMHGGIPVIATQQLPILESGSRVANTATIDGASQNVNYRTVAQASAQGYHNTMTLRTTQTGTNTIKRGAVFTIGFETGDTPALAYDCRRQQTLGREQPFVVVEYAACGDPDTNVDGLRVSPAAIVPGSRSGADQLVIP